MSDRELLGSGLEQLDKLYVAAIAAFAPPNPGFERDRIIRALVNKREIAYVCGFLSEGENEAALIFGLMHELLAADPNGAVGHLFDEARYYLRTSIDPTWQLANAPTTIAAALGYLAIVLKRRIARIATTPVAPPLADHVEPDARALLASRAPIH